MWCINDRDQENRIIQVLQMRCWSEWQCRKRPNVTVLSLNLISYRHCYCGSDLGDRALPSWRGPGSVWQLLGWADGPRNYNFKWHQILREELCFGVRGQLEMRCPTWRMTEERRRMEREAPWHTEATGEDEIFISTQNVLCRVWEVRKTGTYYAYVA